MKSRSETKSLIEQQPTAPESLEMRRQGAVTIEDVMPLLDLASAIRRRNFMVEVTRNLMTEGVDYGTIPGTSSKPVLLKPGAERLCTFFGLSAELHQEMAIEDWDGSGEGHGNEPLFFYRLKCKLTRNGIMLAEGLASCSSRESKYRYRAAERRCPKCGQAAIIRGREEYGGGWLCFARKGGCGAKFQNGAAAIEGQPAGRVINPDVADVANTVLKMACKRALVAAILLATNASEFFTQDEEDMQIIDIPSAQPPRGYDNPSGVVNNEASQQAKPASSQEAQPEFLSQAQPEDSAWSWTNFKGMISEFAKLHERLGPDYDHVYRETLREFGVAYSNEFRNYATAQAAYRKLRVRVLQIEAAAREDTADVEMPSEEFDQRQHDPEVTA